MNTSLSSRVALMVVVLSVTAPSVISWASDEASFDVRRPRMRFALPTGATSVSVDVLGIYIQPPYFSAQDSLRWLESNLRMHPVGSADRVTFALTPGASCDRDSSECLVEVRPLSLLLPEQDYFMGFGLERGGFSLAGWTELEYSEFGEVGVRFRLSGPPRIRKIQARQVDGSRWVLDVLLSERVYSREEPFSEFKGVTACAAECYSTIPPSHWQRFGSARLEFICDQLPLDGTPGVFRVSFVEGPSIEFSLSKVLSVAEGRYVVSQE